MTSIADRGDKVRHVTKFWNDGEPGQAGLA